MNEVILEIKDLYKSYQDKIVINGLNIQINKGEFIGIIGPSGTGKSTLLRCINRLIEPDKGQIFLHDTKVIDITSLNYKELCKVRTKIGMIFQQFNIIKRLSVLQNVLTGSLGYLNPLYSILGFFPLKYKKQALINLDRVGLLEHAHKRANQLSGGEQQRVAIARTLQQTPLVILADEPVSSLDPKLCNTILDILKKISIEDNITIIASLHTLELAKKYSDRILGLKDGNVVFLGKVSELNSSIVNDIYNN